MVEVVMEAEMVEDGDMVVVETCDDVGVTDMKERGTSMPLR